MSFVFSRQFRWFKFFLFFLSFFLSRRKNALYKFPLTRLFYLIFFVQTSKKKKDDLSFWGLISVSLPVSRSCTPFSRTIFLRICCIFALQPFFCFRSGICGQRKCFMTSPTQRRKEKAKKKGREAAFFCADRLYRKAFGLCGERGKGREKKVGGKFFFIRFQTLPRVMIFFYRLQKKKKTRKSSPPLTPPQLLFISALRMSFLPYCTRLPLLPGYELKVFLYLLILQHSNVIQLKPC